MTVHSPLLIGSQRRPSRQGAILVPNSRLARGNGLYAHGPTGSLYTLTQHSKGKASTLRRPGVSGDTNVRPRVGRGVGVDQERGGRLSGQDAPVFLPRVRDARVRRDGAGQSHGHAERRGRATAGGNGRSWWHSWKGKNERKSRGLLKTVPVLSSVCCVIIRKLLRPQYMITTKLPLVG